MIKVGVIGVGSMGQNHARIYSGLDYVELVCISDANQEQGEKIAKRFKTKYYQDYKEMLSNEKLDLVSIVVPSNLHKEVAIEVLNRKINTLLEKPIALNEEEAKEIISAASKNNTKLAIGHIERFNPAIIELKKRLEKKELGEIYKIDVQRIGPFPVRITDVGVIIDIAVHDLDIIDYLIKPKLKRIYAETQQKLHPKYEDSLLALLKYEEGILGVLNINFTSPKKIRKISIFGEKGMFEVNYLTQDIIFYKNSSYKEEEEASFGGKFSGISEGDSIKISIKKEEPLLAEIKSFIECITEDKESPVSGEDGLEALKKANLIMKSAKENKVLNL